MDEVEIRTKMQQVLSLVTSDIGSLRTGRAMPSLVESIICPAYGGTQRLKVQELATITVPDTQTIIIDPWDKSIIGDIKKGIFEANLGLNPGIDGELIRIILPPMTTEDREKYIKLLSGKLENGRIMIRQVRAEAMKDVKKRFEEKEISEDMKFDEEKKVQALTDEFVGKIDEAGEKKETRPLADLTTCKFSCLEYTSDEMSRKERVLVINCLAGRTMSQNGLRELQAGWNEGKLLLGDKEVKLRRIPGKKPLLECNTDCPMTKTFSITIGK